jgi:hypothetical protein
MNDSPNPTDMLSATVSFPLTSDECRTLALRAEREHRTVSQLVRLLFRDVTNSSERLTECGRFPNHISTPHV